MKTTAKDENSAITSLTASVPPDISDLITEDDTPVDNLFSEKQQRLLTEPLYSSWTGGHRQPGQTAEKRRFVAAANVGLFPSVRQPPLVPDMFLSLDVQIGENWYDKRNRSYFFWEFGKPPELVIEIVSTREGNELGSKLSDYAEMGVAYYVVYDPFGELSEEPLLVHELHAGKYRRRRSGVFPELGLSLNLWEGSYEDYRAVWLRWCDDNGVLIPTGAERAAHEQERAESEAHFASRERERAERERERAERLALKLRALGVDPDDS